MVVRIGLPVSGSGIVLGTTTGLPSTLTVMTISVAGLDSRVVDMLCGKRSGRQKAFDLNVFIHIRPMDPDAFPNQLPFAALSLRRFAKARKPFQRSGHLAAIRQHHV